jgi:hypothetical protein
VSSVRTVYAISSGSYSDYTVHCLLETRELAQAYIDALKANREAIAVKNGETYGYDYHTEGIEEFQMWSALPILGMVEKEFPQWGPVTRGVLPKPTGTRKVWVETEEAE